MPKKLKDRFFEKVRKEQDCWLWTASKNHKGYGLFGLNNKCNLAHRISWEVHNGEIPENLCVLHRCDIPSCVNPNHLFLGTRADNIKDMFFKKRNRVPLGEDNALTKLKNFEVLEIRRLYSIGNITQRELAERFNVKRSTISMIVIFATFKSVGGAKCLA